MDHQLSLELIQHTTNGTIIDQRAEDGYINATALCKAAGKLWENYAENRQTKDFLNELEADTGIPISELIQSVEGGDPTLQGTWVHPRVAIHLGQWASPKFAVLVSKWVTKWMSGKEAPTTVSHHIRRHMVNQPKIPPTHFSILQEMALTLIGPLEANGYTLPEHLVPDISQGKMFCKFLRDNGFADTKALPTYEHEFLDGRVVSANLYPVELLGEFRKFISSTWMRTRSIEYFKDRDPAALPYLDKVLALSAAPQPSHKPGGSS